MKVVNKTFEFQGVLNNIDICKSNKNLKRILFEKRILLPLVDCNKNKIELSFNGERRLNYTDFCFKGSEKYEINPKIIGVVYSIARDHSRFKSRVNKLKSELALHTSLHEKVKFLTKENKKNIKKIKKHGFLTHFKNVNFPNLTFEYFLKAVLVTGCPRVIDDFLTNYELDLYKHYNDSDILLVCKGIVCLEKHKFIADSLAKYIDNKSVENSKRLTPLQLVCYIDRLRTCAFSSFSYDEKVNHLNNITGGDNNNINNKLDGLERLIGLSTKEYEDLMDVAAQYAKWLFQISEVNDRNTRGAIKNFILAQIPKSKTAILKTTQLDKYNEACSRVKRAFNEIEKYFG